jgi:1-phosphofructokinase family hexose kinase
MIATLTLNPSVDVTTQLECLTPGQAHRGLATRFDAAGKGINVSLVAQRLGHPTVAFGLIGGETGELLRAMLERERVAHGFVEVAGQTRVNLTVTDGSGAATRFIGAGPPPGRQALEQVRALLKTWAPSTGVLVLSGSLPPGVHAEIYAELIADARAGGVEVILDAHGQALAAGLRARPAWMKPNLHEAEQLLGERIEGDRAAHRAVRRMLAAGAGRVVLSMGAKGALYGSARRCLRLRAPEVERRSWVGAGDAMVAGIAVALVRGQSTEQALRLGTAAGAASAASPGTARGSLEQIHALADRVRLEEYA